jgi:1-deoxy-D-xylulose-5-phosphate synthase
MSSVVRSPEDLKKLSIDQLRHYAEDVRQMILSACLSNGGHLGASLGPVELAIALHFVFDSPREALVWDVGHQAYAHKLITGRAERFNTLRTFGGVSGFLSRDESEHDAFGAGHSSTSLSAALAIAWTKARGDQKINHPQDWTVAVIGDGGLTAGIAFEALNNVRTKAMGPLLVVLNDNQMSISPNVGAVPSILSSGQGEEFFSLFGFDYAGPIDGHNLEELIGVLQGVKKSTTGNPILLHVLTQKGKGYAPAEENPGVFHGIGPLVEKVADRPVAPKQRSFSEAFGKAACEAAENPKVVAISAAMPEGTGLADFSRKFPDRFFDVGIAEPHAVTFAAGLATQGYRPIVAIYSTFLQRALDSVIHDVAIQRLPVVFAIDRAGIVGADGPTHHGVFDLAYLGMIPGLRIFAPATLEDVSTCLKEALVTPGPSAIRYPRGSAPESYPVPLESGVRCHLAHEKPEVILISVGSATQRMEKAVKALGDLSKKCAWVSVVEVKPLPKSVMQYLEAHPGAKVFCLEDGVIHGGFGQQICAGRSGPGGNVELAGYGDHFITHGAPAKLEELENISPAALEARIRGLLT